MAQKLPTGDFAQLIKNAPLVAIDFVVRTTIGKLLLGLRSNEPARGFYFVPGGRIFKDERIADAFSRLAGEELGIDRKITDKNVCFLGVYQHFYSTNALGISGFGTHYVVLAYEMIVEAEILHLPKTQHGQYEWMTPEQALNHPNVHDHSKDYLRIGNIRCEKPPAQK